MSLPLSDTLSLDRPYSRGELVADAAVHTAALVAGAIGFGVLFAKTPWRDRFGEPVALSIYAAAFFALFSFSFAYNMAPESRLKTLLGRCDRSAIFVMIAGTYTALLSQIPGNPWIALLLGFVWSGAIGGAGLTLLAPGSLDRVAVAFYLVLGWSAILVVKPLVVGLPASALLLVLSGGLLYSVGVPFYLWRSLKFQNVIWHGFVASAAACHFVGVLEAATRLK